MTRKTTTTAVSALDAATAAFSALQEQHSAAQAEALTAREYADALPGRLAAGDESVTTENLIQATPAAAVAQAKAQALAHQLTAAREAVMQAQTDELALQLRAGEPFLSSQTINAELEVIAAQALEPINGLAERIEAHNSALFAITGTAKRHDRHVYTTGDGQELAVTREDIELDGNRWSELTTANLGKRVLDIIDGTRAQQRAANYVPAERELTEREFTEQERVRAQLGQHQREQGAQ